MFNASGRADCETNPSRRAAIGPAPRPRRASTAISATQLSHPASASSG